MKIAVLASIFVLALSATSHAADVISAENPEYTWTGGYVGVYAGYGWGNSQHFTTDIPASTDRFNINGALGGLTLGYNYQVDRWVFGAETDISIAGLHGSTGSSSTWNCPGGGCETKVEWFGTARARVGYAFDRTLPYLTGGLAYGNIKGYIQGDYSGSGTKVGWTLGGGVEHAFTDHLTVKAEYLYVDLGKADLVNFGPYGMGHVDAKFSTIKIGLNYKF